MLKDLKGAWVDWVRETNNEEGSSTDVKFGLKLCDRYEKGEI